MKIALLIIGLIIANVMLFWWIFAEQQHRNFERFLKVNDAVDWYNGEIREKYTLEKKSDVWCEIKNPLNGFIRKVKRSELLPNLWQKYEASI